MVQRRRSLQWAVPHEPSSLDTGESGLQTSPPAMPLLFLSLFSSILGLSILFPVLAPLGRELHLTEAQIGLVSTSYALMQFVMSPVWGRASERRGRKPVLLTGVIGFGVGFLLLGLVVEAGARGLISGVPLLAAMVTARMIGGALSSATIPTAQAWAADLTSRENRTSGMAVIGAAFGLAIIFGPVIGGLVSHSFGLLAPIWFSVIIAALNAILVATTLREPERHLERTPPGELRSVLGKARDLLAIGFVSTFASVLMEQTIAFAFEDRLSLAHEETPIYVGSALGCYGVVAVFAQGFLVRRMQIPAGRLLLLGLPLTMTGMGLLVFASDFPMLVLAMALQGLGQGLVMPGVTSALSLSVGDGDQGAVAGANSSAQGLGRLLGPLVGPTLYGVSHELPFAASAALLFCVALFVSARRSVRTIGAAPAS
jgi:MFS family permease